MNKNKLFVITFCAIIILSIFLFLIITKDDKNILDQISKTKIIVVNKYTGDNFIKIKEISNENEVDEIVNLFQDIQAMSPNESIPYGIIPNYKLELLDKKGSIITEINFFVYENISWISFENEKTSYTINDEELLKMIEV